jgi:hypothetical protein
VIDRYLRSWVDSVEELRGRGMDPGQVILEGLDIHRRTIEVHPDGVRLFFVALERALSGDRLLRESFENSVMAFRATFGRLLADLTGEPEPGAVERAEALADLVHATFVGFGYIALLDDGLDLDREYAMLREQVTRWLDSVSPA